MSEHHLFEHEAMKTVFTLRLIETDAALARDAARAAIELLDSIEQQLSRYIEGSDVWQINHMKSEQSQFISEICYDCLLLSLQASERTGGLFDSTIGKSIEHQKNAQAGTVPILTGQLQIDPKRPAIHCIQAGREIDLGGIGKGFALDRMQNCLKDWNISSALLSAGSSTQLAFGKTAWPISLEHQEKRHVINLKNQALSASGTEIQGSHIIDPRQQTFDYQYPHIWILHKSAALADAFSTAGLLMNQIELEQLKAHASVFTPDDFKPFAAPPN